MTIELDAFSLKTSRGTLTGPDLKFPPGSLVHIVGRSDSRAEDVCFLLAGLIDKLARIHPAAPGRLVRRPENIDPRGLGFLKFQGRPVYDLPDAERARSIGVVFGEPSQYVIGATVQEEFAYTFAAAERDQPPLQVLAAYGLYGKTTNRTELLSAGESHRLNWACVLELHTPVIVADLSRSNVDSSFRGALVQWLESRAQGGAIVFSFGLPLGSLKASHVLRAENGAISLGTASSTELEAQKRENEQLKSAFLRYSDPNHVDSDDVIRVAGVARRGVTLPVNFTIRRGEVVQIRGENGCGKTTLGRILSGQVHVDHRTGHTEPDTSALGIAMALQSPSRMFTSSKLSSEIPSYLLSKCDLPSGAADRPGADLSFSKQKLLATAIALHIGSDLAILDEPTVGMDPEDKLIFVRLLAERTQSVLILTHDPALTDIGTTLKWEDIAA